jgi:hypothetical protein
MLIWERRSMGVLCDVFGAGAATQGLSSIADAGIAAAASIYGADQQAEASKYATNATSTTAANSLDFNKGVYNNTLTNEQPYMAAGSSAANSLSAGLTDGSLTAGYAPQFSFSGVNQANDPAYQFDLSQGQDAIQKSAAAQGGLVSGGALKDLDTFSQGYASNQYQQSYANSLAQYQQAYNQFETQQGNQFNRLASTAGLGQNAVTQTATSGASASGTNAAVAGSANSTIAALTTAQGANAASSANTLANTLTGGINSLANGYQSSTGSSYGPTVPTGAYNTPPTQAQWDTYDAGSTPVYG